VFIRVSRLNLAVFGLSAVVMLVVGALIVSRNSTWGWSLISAGAGMLLTLVWVQLPWSSRRIS